MPVIEIVLAAPVAFDCITRCWPSEPVMTDAVTPALPDAELIDDAMSDSDAPAATLTLNAGLLPKVMLSEPAEIVSADVTPADDSLLAVASCVTLTEYEPATAPLPLLIVVAMPVPLAVAARLPSAVPSERPVSAVCSADSAPSAGRSRTTAYCRSSGGSAGSAIARPSSRSPAS